MDQYLAPCPIIDWQTPAVLAKASELAHGFDSAQEIARECFLFVRDEILHSWDHQLNPVTCKASDVLQHRTGFCYAKSHLLAALCRANSIPTGFCYQRLTRDGAAPPFCLHGLNAIYLPEFGWYRVDARGQKSDVDSRFTPPVEQLAFPICTPGEIDLPEIWPTPLPLITHVLATSSTFMEVAENLPDLQIIDQTPTATRKRK